MAHNLPLYQRNGISLHCDDCQTVLPTLGDNSIDLIATDPPYALSFMGKDWDTIKSMPEFFIPIWKECLRVLKHGAFAFVMCSPRQDVLSRQITNLHDAGFNVGFTSIYWCYAEGFPKAENIGKAVDKRLGIEREVIGTKTRGDVEKAKQSGTTFAVADANKNNKAIFGYGVERITKPATSQAKALDGSYGGFQPKPAVEVIIVAMKPLSEKTYVDQALKNQKGITWLDEGRIPYGQETDDRFGTNKVWHNRKRNEVNIYGAGAGIPQIDLVSNPIGRFPANLLVSDDVLNDGQTHQGWSGQEHKTEFNPYGGASLNPSVTTRKGSFEGYNDSGSFSRYFDLDKWWTKTFPFFIVSKPSKGEKNRLLDGKGTGSNTYNRKCLNCGKWQRKQGLSDDYTCHCETPNWEKPTQNYHPTVKPLKLMTYLVTIGSRPNDIVLDPFVGSGTTALACQIINRKCIGIDNKQEYLTIAVERLKQSVMPLE